MHHVVVHAHCYQPPREDPWLELVETEVSAAPDHDWNARIDRECYARLAETAVRRRDPHAAPNDPDARSGLSRLINLYGWCNFDVGATLCEWLDTEAPQTLRAMTDGDAASVRRWGHGNAIAQPYHHVILPLASPRDRRTEVRWGIADFQRRFGRTPEGMWLPECAADEDTLDLLAQEGVRFTILAPYQVHAGAETHGLPVRWRGAAGRSLTILPYDGELAGEVAFGGLLRDAKALARRLAPTIDDGQPRCTTLATDGETFGHHHRSGERTLAKAMAMIAQRDDATMTNAATMVANFPPTLEARLVSPSSWSCAHGIERWRANCGCRIDQERPAAQQWRGPLRVALEGLARQNAELFAREGRTLFKQDPWTVRDGYGAVVAMDGDVLNSFVHDSVRNDVDASGVQRARELLEMQRATLRTFTSCAWFFDEVDRIEIRQVLRYALRTIELSQHPASVVEEFQAALQVARGAVPGSQSARDVLLRAVMPVRHPTINVAAGAIALAHASLPCTRLGTYDILVTTATHGSHRWRATLHHRRTGATSSFEGVVSGEGPSVHVTIGNDVIAVHDFPEVIALALLRVGALGDAAMLDRE